MRKLTRQELHNLLLGAAIVGTGGGGALETGIKIVNKALDDGLSFEMAENEDIPDDALIGTPYGCGSISPLTEKQIKAMAKLKKIDTSAEVAAIKVLEKYYGEEFFGVVATELGGMNTAVALEVAARLGKPIIDADPAGRSVPCLQHSTYYLNDIPIGPVAMANAFGDEILLTKTLSDERAEALARSAAVASFNHVGVVDHPNRWHVLKDALLKNTLSMCLDIGQMASDAISENRSYAQDIVNKYTGAIMFTGVIETTDWEDRDGFTFGNIYIRGEGEHIGKTMRIWYQNENLLSWVDDEVFVTAPDSINIVNETTHMPLLNPDAEAGMPVTVFALRAFDEWRVPKAIEILGPKFFGFDYPYRTLEEVIK